MKTLVKILMASICMITCSFVNVYAKYNDQVQEVSVQNEIPISKNAQDEIPISMDDIDNLLKIVERIHNDNVSNDYYTNERYKKQGKSPSSNTASRSARVLELVDMLAEKSEKILSGEYSTDDIMDCYSLLLQIDREIREEQITFNKSLSDYMFAAVNKFLPFIKYVSNNYKDALKRENLPVYPG